MRKRPAAKRDAAMALIMVTFTLAFPRHAISSDYYFPHHVYTLNGGILCFARHEGFFTTSTGPCDGFTAPQEIVLGATFTANGKMRKIGVIRAIQADKDWKYGDVEMKKGEWSCAAAKSNLDLADNSHSALWISVSKCQPVN